MKPGGTALTVMPLGPYSRASDLVSPLTADFAATYGAMYGWPEWVLDEEMLTMRPQPASTMSGSTAWTQWKTPLRLTSIDPLPVLERDLGEPLELLESGGVHQDRDRSELGADAPRAPSST